MDELLELMNSDPTSVAVSDHDFHSDVEEQERNNVSSARTRDKNDISGRNIQKTNRYTSRNRPAPTIPPPSYQNESKNLAKASIDDSLGIRMTNRLVSSNDLSELITDYDYFSPSVLSAMTLKRLNSLLQTPSQIIDPATVAGKTESLVTVGIVFSNSGTRISSKGGAFCVLTIGNLNSGPCLTIFLFGEVYGKHCVSCKPGKVIALMTPKLLPANRGDGSSKNQNADRTVSFSVYDAGQLKIVANARDYGMCKESGCKNYVDKRNSEFCDYHRRRQLRKAKGGNQTQNRLQQLKSVHLQGRSALVDSTARKSNVILSTSVKKSNVIVSTSSKKFNRFLDKTPVTNTQLGKPAVKRTNVGSAGTSTPSTRFGTTKVPMHMTKNTPNQKSINPYRSSTSFPCARTTSAKRDAATNGDNSTATKRTKRPKKNSSCGNWLEDELSNAKERGPANVSSRRGFSLGHFTKSKQRSGTATSNAATRNTKNRPITTDGGLDGYVVIPTPSKIFQKQTTFNEVNRRTVTPKDESKKADEIFQQQAEAARQMRERKPTKYEKIDANRALSKSRTKASHSKVSTNSRSTPKSNEVDDFLASMGDFDQDKIRNAKSKFANEVEADEYAKRRRRVEELEKAEASHESRNKKKKSEESKITKKWFCQTCGKNYFKKPMACYSASHAVKSVREIQNEVTNNERRNELNKKSSDNGGLRLGEGLAWSYSRN